MQTTPEQKAKLRAIFEEIPSVPPEEFDLLRNQWGNRLEDMRKITPRIRYTLTLVLKGNEPLRYCFWRDKEVKAFQKMAMETGRVSFSIIKEELGEWQPYGGSE